MEIQSRSQKAIKNASIGILSYLLPVLATFIFRRYFILHLGGELLGLNNIVVNILGFLNASELGLASAIAYALYKPLYEGNKQEVIDIVSIQAVFYRWIARFILLASIIIFFFFSKIFAKVDLPLWYAYATYFVLLSGTLLSYYFNYRQVVFISDQKGYIPNLCIHIPRFIKLILQTLCIIYLSHGYIWWLSLELIWYITTTVSIEYFVRKSYPWLRVDRKQFGQLIKTYPEILIRTKQLIVHRLAAVVLDQGSPLVLFGVTAAAYAVTVYNNYLLVYASIAATLRILFGALTSSLGHKIVEEKKQTSGTESMASLFGRIYSLRNFFSTAVVGILLIFMPSFIELWLGKEMLFDTGTFYISLGYIYYASNRSTDDFLAAYGLYQDVWAPFVELSLNLGLSILLGMQFGIAGIWSGIIISQIVIVYLWKPYFLYQQGLHTPLRHYLLLLTHNRLMSLVAIVLIYQVMIPSYPIESWGQFIPEFLWRGGSVTLITGVIFIGLSAFFRQIVMQTLRQLHLH